MINLANHYGIRVIAEGIESNDQWHFLSQTTCKAGQGFYISRPLSAEQTYLMLKRLADDSLSSTF
jgi:EAL domain-containing protein (putative c-di-GMP-specific phosphodiesterase class I)